MGNKDKKKSKRLSRSRSRSRSRDTDSSKRSKNKRKKRSDSSSDTSGSDTSSSRSSSRGHRSHKHKSKSKHKKRSRSRERSKRPAIARPPTVEELERFKEERKRDKELSKALETPEEKRLRRVAKKDAKERKRKEQMGWDEEYMGYTNEDNPFGDETLLDTFVWGKKLEREGKTDLQKSDIDKLHKKKMIENKLELEKVKKRRIERENEREERERDREMMQREKEAEYFREWEKQEDTFHLQQAKMRSKIRIEDARAKPIDLLGKYISAEDDDYAVEMHEPYTYLNGLTMQDLEDLLEDIKVYVELEQGKNVDYWRDITIITEEELNKLRKLDASSKDFIGERRSGINQAVKEDVAGVFKGKTLNQLHILEDSINNKLSGGEGVDVGYWESLLQQLKAHMARTRLRERHQEQLRRKLFKLKQEQGIESTLFPIIKRDKDSDTDSVSKRQSSRNPTPVPEVSTSEEPMPGTSSQVEQAGQSGSQDQQTEVKPGTDPDAEGEINISEDDDDDGAADDKGSGGEGQAAGEDPEEEVVEEDPAYLEFDTGGYSPKMLRPSELEPDAILIDPQEDSRNLEVTRRHALHTGVAKKDDDEELIKKAKEGMNSEEAQFSVQIPVEQPQFIWSDKYRPRKPRFFNRVHTGFEWNKYNQTHYDIDNPPPKIVQGYKFNIFFPDLIDKTKTPEYTLTPLEGNRDFAMLKFHAGPPYEDIAFKIVNREWEYSYKRGFRCQFHNNIFQLWFHFKRYRYRR